MVLSDSRAAPPDSEEAPVISIPLSSLKKNLFHRLFSLCSVNSITISHYGYDLSRYDTALLYILLSSVFIRIHVQFKLDIEIKIPHDVFWQEPQTYTILFVLLALVCMIMLLDKPLFTNIIYNIFPHPSFLPVFYDSSPIVFSLRASLMLSRVLCVFSRRFQVFLEY